MCWKPMIGRQLKFHIFHKFQEYHKVYFCSFHKIFVFSYLSYLWKQIEHFASRLVIAERKTQKPSNQCLANPTVPFNAMQWFSSDGCLKIAMVGNKKVGMGGDGLGLDARPSKNGNQRPRTPQNKLPLHCFNFWLSLHSISIELLAELSKIGGPLHKVQNFASSAVLSRLVLLSGLVWSTPSVTIQTPLRRDWIIL